MNKVARMLGIGSWRATALNGKKWEKLLKRAKIFMSRRANDDGGGDDDDDDDDNDDDDHKTIYYF
jgi:hypothetical protein